VTRIDIDGQRLRVVVEGLDKVLAFKSTIDVPLAHVKGAGLHPQGRTPSDYRGIRVPGTWVPGVVTAGSFYDGQWLFIDVHHADHAIKIDLDHEHCEALIVEVDDPEAEVSLINAAVSRAN
jgi:hypothetical protein